MTTEEKVKKKAAAKKVKTGYKICRYAQFPDGEKAIMPSVLSELLASRKATRKLAKHKIVTTLEGKEVVGLLTKTDTHHEVLQENKIVEKIENENVESVEDRFDDFMKNVLDKRQLGYKVTANSLYGQCGARTSTFYEKDVAASTTATGRMMIMYARRMIEEIYGDLVYDTKCHGRVRCRAEYIYGDTDSVFYTLNLEHPETGEKIRGKKALECTIEISKDIDFVFSIQSIILRTSAITSLPIPSPGKIRIFLLLILYYPRMRELDTFFIFRNFIFFLKC